MPAAAAILHSAMSSSTRDRSQPLIAFIGGGNMARSLIAGLREQGHPGEKLRVADPNREALAALVQDFAIAASDSADDAVTGAALVVLAVKPQVMREVCTALAPTLERNGVTVVSIAAGIRSEQIDGWLGGGRAIVRAMPNTPALLRAGATGLYANERCDADARELADGLLTAVGVTVWLDNEDLIDAVTAVSGSGPAYFFRMIEALQAAGVAQGLDEDAARTLVLHTALGAARMAIESGESASVLRQRVTSPGGTTAAAMKALDTDDFDSSLDRAVAAAVQRSRELSNQT